MTFHASDRFKAEIRHSHTVICFADVTSPHGETTRLKIIDGDMAADRTASFRRSVKLTCIDPKGILVPRGPESLLTPYGTIVRPYRGVRFTDGTTEVAPLGVFRLSKSTVGSTGTAVPAGSIAVEGFDLSRTVARDKFVTTYTIPVGTNVIDAIKTILARTFPDLQYDAISTPVTTTAPRVYDAGGDPWDAVTQLAASIGCDIYFDVEGWVVIAPSTDIDALPSAEFTYVEGEGTLTLGLQRIFVDEPGYNGVIVTGESLGDELPAVRAEVWDDEPTSPTYRLGPYGEVPMFITDQLVKTQEQAQNVADQKLRAQLGFSTQLTITGIVYSAYEIGSVIQVESQQSGVSGLYLLDAFNVPMKSSGTQTIGARQMRKVQ